MASIARGKRIHSTVCSITEFNILFDYNIPAMNEDETVNCGRKSWQ